MESAPQSTVGIIARGLGGQLARSVSSRAARWRQSAPSSPPGRLLSSPPGRFGARWAARRDLVDLAVAAPGQGRLVLGRQGRTLLATEKRHSVLAVGPTQTGKTSGLAIPALLEWEGPVIAASVKSDLLSATHSWRARRGETWIFDPGASSTFPSDGWSPLPACGDWTGARRTAAALASQGARTGLTDGDFWYAAAAKLLAPLLFAAARSGATMSDVVAWVNTQEADDVEIILQEAGCRPALEAASASFRREERQKSSIYTTAETLLEAFADPGVGNLPPGAGFDPARLLDGGSHTLYICAPAHEQARLRPLFCTLVEQVVTMAYDQCLGSGDVLDPPLLILLDEAANIAPLAILDTLASTASSHGIQLMTVWQDFAQIRARYGDRSSTVVNNHRAKVFLSGISDVDTLDYVSRLAGDATVQETSYTRDGHGARSTTWQSKHQALMPSAEVRHLLPGCGVLFYGHLPPVNIALRPFYREEELRRRSG